MEGGVGPKGQGASSESDLLLRKDATGVSPGLCGDALLGGAPVGVLPVTSSRGHPCTSFLTVFQCDRPTLPPTRRLMFNKSAEARWRAFVILAVR